MTLAEPATDAGSSLRSERRRARFRFAAKLAAVTFNGTMTEREARTYQALTVSKASTYGAFVSALQALARESASSSSHRGDAAKAVLTLAHGLVLEFIDEGLDLGTTPKAPRMTARLAMASRLIKMLSSRGADAP